MTWLRRILGIEQIPAPEVGQVYISGNNGQKIKIADVHKSMSGHLYISVFRWRDGRSYRGVPICGWGIADPFAYGISDWRRQARACRLTLAGIDKP